jgi:hypothetical protein
MRELPTRISKQAETAKSALSLELLSIGRNRGGIQLAPWITGDKNARITQNEDVPFLLYNIKYSGRAKGAKMVLHFTAD